MQTDGVRGKAISEAFHEMQEISNKQIHLTYFKDKLCELLLVDFLRVNYLKNGVYKISVTIITISGKSAYQEACRSANRLQELQMFISRFGRISVDVENYENDKIWKGRIKEASAGKRNGNGWFRFVPQGLQVAQD
jgi:hypothetical protein